VERDPARTLRHREQRVGLRPRERDVVRVLDVRAAADRLVGRTVEPAVRPPPEQQDGVRLRRRDGQDVAAAGEVHALETLPEARRYDPLHRARIELEPGLCAFLHRHGFACNAGCRLTPA
jgi:hypothetical protein